MEPNQQTENGFLDRWFPIFLPEDEFVQGMGMVMVVMLAYTAIFTAYQVAGFIRGSPLVSFLMIGCTGVFPLGC